MKLFFPIAVILLPILGQAQGTFENLDFEEANPSLGTGAPALMPGWQVFYGNSPSSAVGYDALALSVSGITIWDNKTGYSPLQGNYTAFLQSVVLPIASESVSLSQAGIIPPGTQSIEIDANEETDGAFTVTINGQIVDMMALKTFPNYTLFGGNVSAWSGQSATLAITQLAPPLADQQFSPSLLQLDDVTFSPVAVIPEPDALALMGIGGLLFGLYRRLQATGR